MKNLVRIACVLIAALLGGCGGSGGESAATPTAAADTRLVLDTMAWDQGDWAD